MIEEPSPLVGVIHLLVFELCPTESPGINVSFLRAVYLIQHEPVAWAERDRQNWSENIQFNSIRFD